MAASCITLCPDDDADEACLLGRSNVGKSTLINALARHTIAHTSKQPGATRTLNFYDFGVLRLVDCPGYGYAKISQQLRTALGDLISTYLTTRPNLRVVIHLVAANVVTADDQWVSAFVRAQTAARYLVAVNKIDRLSKNQLVTLKQQVASYLKVDPAQVFCVSAKHKTGLSSLYQATKQT